MFISQAWAQDAAASGGSAGMMWLAAQIALIVVVFYFVLWRPQTQQAQSRAKLLAEIKTGQTVVLLAGMVAVVRKVFDKEALLEVEVLPNGGRMWIERGAVERVWDDKVTLPKTVDEPVTKKR